MEPAAAQPRTPGRRRAGLAATALAAGLLTVPAGPLDLALAPYTASAVAAPVPPVPGDLPSGIEPLAPYEPQTTCFVESEGSRRLSRLVLGTYPGTGSGGIVRDCGLGGSSEHKEGRAWDWSVDATSSTQAAYADAFLDWLLAPDAAGNSYAMARRLGVMYVVWDREIWSAEQASGGWRPYTGRDPHTSHMHISLSRDGGAAATSYWTGVVATGGRAPSGSGGTPVLEPGDQGPAVQELQRRLGLAPDGVFGPGTGTALVEFQKGRGLTADGVAGPATWSALAPVASASASASAGGSAVGDVLREGDRGPGVEELQRRLGLAPDGAFGPATAAALAAFQAERGLVADGVAGAATWSALAPSSGSASGSASGGAASTAPGDVLREGDRGAGVEALQRGLGVPADGAFGPGTAAALVDFQTERGLVADGVAGPATWNALGSTASAESAGGTAVLRLGDTGEEVRELQSALGLAGDGAFGPGTHEAVKAVQRGAGLPVDGVVGTRTWSVVRGGGASPSTSVADDGGRPVLRAGDRSSAVAEAQRLLGLPADGVFGPGTHEAVKTVQRAAGLTPDGVVGARTWAVLG